MARKMIFGLSLVLLAGALTATSFASAIEIDLLTSSYGSVTVGNTGAKFFSTKGTAVQDPNLGTYTLTAATYTGTGCGSLSVCTLTGGPQTLTVKIGSDVLVGAVTLTTDAANDDFIGSMHINSATAGFASTGYIPGQTVGVHFVVTGTRISVAEIESDSPPTPEPGTMAMLGSGLLAVAGFLRRKL